MRAATIAIAAAVTLLPAPASAIPTAVATQENYSQHFYFLRDEIGLRAYSGCLLGPAGVLAERSGNSLDKALLLEQLLRQSGFTTRFAFGRLRTQSLDLVMELVLGRTENEEGGAETALARSDERLRAIMSDHYWVQIKAGSEWLNLDPTLPESEPGQTIAQMFKYFEKVPTHLYQLFELEIFSEFQTGNRTARTRVLRYTSLAMDLHERPLTLVFLGRGSDGLYRYSSGENLSPVLITGSKTYTSLNLQAESSRTAAQTGSTEREVTVNRMWLEISLSAPAGPTRRIVRILRTTGGRKITRLDELITITLATRGITWGLVNFLGRQLEEAAAAIDSIRLPTLPQALSDREKADMTTLLAAQRNLSFALNTFLLAQIHSTGGWLSGGFDTSMTTESPYLLAASCDPRAGRVRADIMSLGGSFLPGAGTYEIAAPAAMFTRSLHAAALESLLMQSLAGPTRTGGSRYGSYYSALSATRQSLRRREPWHAVSKGNTGDLDGYPVAAEFRRQFEAAIDNGKVILLPGRSSAGGGDNPPFWWELDPETGAMLGVIEPGIGGAQVNLLEDLTDIAAVYAPGFSSGWPDKLADLSRSAAQVLRVGTEIWRKDLCTQINDMLPAVHDAVSKALSGGAEHNISPEVRRFFSLEGSVFLSKAMEKLCP